MPEKKTSEVWDPLNNVNHIPDIRNMIGIDMDDHFVDVNKMVGGIKTESEVLLVFYGRII